MEKQRWEESEKRRAEERRSEKRTSEKKEDAGARKGSNVTKQHCVFFQWFVARKVGSLKRRVRSHFWKLRCRKSARHCGAKKIPSQKCKNWRARSTSGRSVVVSCDRHKGLCTVSKLRKTWGFSTISKNDGRRGSFEEDLERCIFRGKRSARDMFSGDVRRSGCWFPEMGCILVHQIVTFAKMILRDRCSISHHFFRGRRNTLETDGVEKSRNALVRGRQLCTQLSIFEGSLPELLRFWCCQLRKLRKSRRFVSFLTLPSSKIDTLH